MNLKYEPARKKEIKELITQNKDLHKRIKRLEAENLILQGKIAHLKNCDPNERLLAESPLKRKGYSRKEFYDTFIMRYKKEKPQFSKTKYPIIIKKLFNDGSLVCTFKESKSWGIRRMEILKRDKWLCQECLRKDIMRETNIVHHISSDIFYPEICLDPKNLITVCIDCHKEKHPLYSPLWKSL